MFDLVVVETNALMTQLGIAGRIGHVYGQTAPSSGLAVDVVGPLFEDYAVNIYFDDEMRAYWLGEHNVAVVASARSWTLVPSGPPVARVRQADGSWFEYRPTPAEIALVETQYASSTVHLPANAFPTGPVPRR